jgi:uncharacterized repeat protein (TIGR01451 family)
MPGTQAARLLPVGLITALGLAILAGDVHGVGIPDPSVVVTPASLPLQPVGTPFLDPVFGTILRRVSNTSSSGGFETQIYSQLQAFSSDNTYLLLDGSSGFVVRRVSDFSLVGGLDTSGWNAPRWHPTQVHTIVHFDSNSDTVVRLQFTDVDALTTSTVFTFPAQYERVRVNQSFDELSEDGRWLAGMVSRNDGAQVIFALDLQTGTLGAELPLPDLYAGPCTPDPVWGQVEPDWIGVSPLGKYLVVQWPRDGTTRCSGLETFDLRTGAFVGRVYDGHQHGDLGVEPDGVTEFFMTFELYHPSGNLAIGVRNLPGTSTVSPPTYVRVMGWFGEHISCRGRYGVCLVTTTGDPSNGWSALEGEVFLQSTDGSVLRLVHHRSSSCGYWVQPRASISRDGRYVVFASDWRYGTETNSCTGRDPLGRGDPYVVDLAATGGGSADLALTKTDSPDPVTVGQNLTYTVTVTNKGPDVATGVTLTDTLPGGVTFVSASPVQGSCAEASGVVTCPLGTLANGATATVTIVVTPRAPGTITNTARVTGTPPDPDAANNTVTEGTTVIAGPCPISLALRRTPEREATLETAYRFRDEVLARSPEGRRYIRLFYQHAWEGTGLLLRHPDLRARTRDVLARLRPTFRAVVDGQLAALTSEDLAALEDLMDAFAARARPWWVYWRLHRTIEQLRSELYRGELLSRFGIGVEAECGDARCRPGR